MMVKWKAASRAQGILMLILMDERNYDNDRTVQL